MIDSSLNRKEEFFIARNDKTLKLLKRIKSGDLDALEELYSLHKTQVCTSAAVYKKKVSYLPVEYDDLLSACHEAFMICVEHFDFDFDIDFSNYLNKCMQNQMSKACAASVKLSFPLDGTKISLDDFLDDREHNTLHEIIGKPDEYETYNLQTKFDELLEDVNLGLTNKEYLVIRLLLDGKDVTDIMRLTGFSRSNVYRLKENALHKIRLAIHVIDD